MILKLNAEITRLTFSQVNILVETIPDIYYPYKDKAAGRFRLLKASKYKG